MRKLLSLLLCLGLGFGFNSCKDDEDTDDGPKTPTKVEIPKIETSISENHPDSHAKAVKDQVESMNSYGFNELYSSFLQTFGSLPWQKDGNVYTFSQIYAGVGFKYEITENATNSVFRYYFTGELDGSIVNNALLYEVTTTLDGKSGSWKYFTVKAPTFASLTYTWSTSGTGVITAQMTIKDSAADVLLTTITIHSNLNKSGDSEWVANGVKTSTAIWAADGSGEQKFYNEGGEVTQTYTWGKNP